MIKRQQCYAVILAGGSGTRFWPLSRSNFPKQFLKIVGKESLFEQALRRIKPMVPPENILIVTNRRFRALIAKQSKAFRVPAANILYEPSGRNTAPAICWAAARIAEKDPDGVMMVLSSDHLIQQENKFRQILTKAANLAQDGFLVTLGIKPTRPETGYGYLQTTSIRHGKGQVLKVKRFTEKPSLPKANVFYRRGDYYWNSGMFIWKSSRILEEFKQHLPDVYKILGSDSRQKSIEKVWNKLQSISIDYGILEKAKQVVAVEALNIGWSDVGSWEALSEVISKDKQGNSLKGNAISVGVKNSILWADQKIIAVIGLSNIAVIDTPDALLICDLKQSQLIREVVNQLKERGSSSL